jgi:hypothetical protein
MLRVPYSTLRLATAVSRTTTAAPRRSVVGLRYQSSNPSGAPAGVPDKALEAAAADGRHAYLKEANRQMEKYHQTRELMKAGKLKSVNTHRGPKNAAGAQMAVVGVFLALFLCTPFIGKKIAQDEDFRKKWVPSFYDFTVKKPENPWTREELHEQMVQVQRDIRERAIRGEFTPEKMKEMQGSLEGLNYPNRSGIDKSKIPKGWDKIHPGLDDDEELNEA